MNIQGRASYRSSASREGSPHTLVSNTIPSKSPTTHNHSRYRSPEQHARQGCGERIFGTPKTDSSFSDAETSPINDSRTSVNSTYTSETCAKSRTVSLDQDASKSALKKKPVLVSKSKASSSTSSYYGIIFLFVFALFGVVVRYAPWSYTDPREPRNCSFSEIKVKYPSQEDFLWKSLQIGIENILNDERGSPAVFLFMHNGSEHAKNLIRDIVRTSSICSDPSSKPFKMTKEDFIMSPDSAEDGDYGKAIQKYKETINEENVLLVTKLNEIPGTAARALHAICDTYNPLVKRVIIFLTLLAHIDQNEGPAVKLAENILFEMWGSSIKRSDLDALITRVTDQVFLLN